ncbi:HEXXH motif domain-containing protein [Asanoa iriomotensis]|uniref:HEXXH motif domain-containing protein n=1 Tax=Asanoa iriomotensis TaxID=234613 RepID=A0ABQ4CDE7_9ACTN|nr:HEXXH motif domain-containing protein [Asanoa iriomotensis]GIF60803.1 HEXXH motif domain-containing protein [Asanoa iriomotensis]
MTGITWTELTALGGGHLDAAAVTALANGQHRKRIVMLTLLLDRVAERCPAETAGVEAAFGLLADAQARDPRAVRDVLMDPAVGAWLARMLRRLHTTDAADDELAYLSAIAVAGAARAGHACVTELALRDGSVVIPTLGRIDLPGERTVTVTVQDGRLTVDGEQLAERHGWQPMRRNTSYAGARTLVVDLDDLASAATRLSEAELAGWRSALDSAWTVLADDNPGRADAIAAGLRRIVPLAPNAAGEAASVTSRDSFGSIATTLPHDGLTCADTLIHEFHHAVLYALGDLVALHRADDQPVHYSPWRDDPRPIDGLLHGAYSYLGVVDFWRGQREVLTGPRRRFADFEFARWRRQVVMAGRLLLDSALLTDDGTTFVASLVATAEQWLAIPVDDRPRRLADQTVADHLIRWRLRHRLPDPAAVAAIAAARRAGLPCPSHPATIDGEVRPHPPGQPLSDRTRLAAIAARGEDALAAATGDVDDLRLVAGAVAEANAGYLERVRHTPSDIESWAGLALCSPEGSALRTAPEVVRAVAAATDDLDLSALDRWLRAPVLERTDI